MSQLQVGASTANLVIKAADASASLYKSWCSSLSVSCAVALGVPAANQTCCAVCCAHAVHPCSQATRSTVPAAAVAAPSVAAAGQCTCLA
jgi:hypothetical protein